MVHLRPIQSPSVGGDLLVSCISVGVSRKRFSVQALPSVLLPHCMRRRRLPPRRIMLAVRRHCRQRIPDRMHDPTPADRQHRSWGSRFRGYLSVKLSMQPAAPLHLA